MYYKIYEISDYENLEQLGTKEKFWYQDRHLNQKTLFKIGRPGTGENWAEKATSELAKLLSIPCASYSFARWNGKSGVASGTFVPDGGTLIHGNELLAFVDNTYPTETNVLRIPEYKINNVFKLFEEHGKAIELPINYQPEPYTSKIGDMFLVYLMFDCWIANSDRHHQNWGYIIDYKSNHYHLAPTYDHASGLGCRTSKDEIEGRLSSRDMRFTVQAFANKAKTPFYNATGARVKTLDAFLFFAKSLPNTAIHWLEKLESLSNISIEEIFNRIPPELISDQSIAFALKLLEENKKRLLETRKVLV
ncbi:HipA domain-containing protein [Desulfopila aestuarii]|uniref:HipA-like C-terminal domain-containing protein n=1 Tax=Desulfopila aestuarii DSM 18488 TaxID=1121416 RepID=A0A1M7YI25_9BACT|nr:hypothetical protein [Desulfopila aestuarii]SHO52271.1 hypothetical protein SAMN02745220_04481 [Desulfopila aestuarii DSM 18488]